jgi:hypothetical protein
MEVNNDNFREEYLHNPKLYQSIPEEVMKENEPKVKDSQKWWKEKSLMGRIDNKPLFALYEPDKATYDRLVTLEAKIEALKSCLFYTAVESTIRHIHRDINHYESELAELVKELKI